jgi:hypothetical protein
MDDFFSCIFPDFIGGSMGEVPEVFPFQEPLP